MKRRQFLLASLAAPFAMARQVHAESGAHIPIADMHAHLFFIGPHPAQKYPLGPAMAAGGATLVAWSLVGDLPWIGRSSSGLRQKGNPGAGAAVKWLHDEVGRAKQHMASQNLKAVSTPADIDHAVDGVPHVVLAVEGASFVDGDLKAVQTAHELGVRHLQLVHFIGNTIGDFQTEKPRHNGLTGFGREVIQECNRLGILVDLAHCTETTARQALDVSTAPVVWSHGSVTRGKQPDWRMAPGKARQISFETARLITEKGGVIGLWGLRSDVGATPEAYAERLMEMAEWLGHEHVAFGSDMNAISNSPIASFADMRRALNHMAKRGLEPAHLKNIAIANYARVLRRAMEPRPT
jgi:membrane dipeptidase